MTILNDRMKLTTLFENESTVVYHGKLRMPLVLSNRQLFFAFHREKLEDGTFRIAASSKGCDDYRDSKASEKGKDVIGNLIINYFEAKPLPDGKGYAIK